LINAPWLAVNLTMVADSVAGGAVNLSKTRQMALLGILPAS
jgi:hypothetical protein